MFTQRLNVNVYNSFIHNHQKWKQSKRPPTGKRINCAPSITTEYHSAMGRSKRGLQSVKGADRKCYLLCDSTYMAFWNRQCYWTEINQWRPRDGGLGEGDERQRGTREFWRVVIISSILTVVVNTQLVISVKTHQTLYLNRMNFAVYKLHFNKSDFKNKINCHIFPSFLMILCIFYSCSYKSVCVCVCVSTSLQIHMYTYVCTHSYRYSSICK